MDGIHGTRNIENGADKIFLKPVTPAGGYIYIERCFGRWEPSLVCPRANQRPETNIWNNRRRGFSWGSCKIYRTPAKGFRQRGPGRGFQGKTHQHLSQSSPRRATLPPMASCRREIAANHLGGACLARLNAVRCRSHSCFFVPRQFVRRVRTAKPSADTFSAKLNKNRSRSIGKHERPETLAHCYLWLCRLSAPLTFSS